MVKWTFLIRLFLISNFILPHIFFFIYLLHSFNIVFMMVFVWLFLSIDKIDIISVVPDWWSYSRRLFLHLRWVLLARRNNRYLFLSIWLSPIRIFRDLLWFSSLCWINDKYNKQVGWNILSGKGVIVDARDICIFVLLNNWWGYLEIYT